jgi:hypothetical protein
MTPFNEMVIVHKLGMNGYRYREVIYFSISSFNVNTHHSNVVTCACKKGICSSEPYNLIFKWKKKKQQQLTID